jgi:formylglycine-generating enzyme required for sulfatase activity
VEWHYAARGGVSSNRFPWGNTIDHNKANYAGLPTSYDYDLGYAGCDTRYAKIPFPFTSPAGSFEDGKNGYGLYDMAGNVWEWCWDWDPGYEGRFRVARGGSWDFYAQESRVAFRGIRYPNYANYGVGFRAILPTGQ